jgi:outer membrane protein assembly factor BamB
LAKVDKLLPATGLQGAQPPKREVNMRRLGCCGLLLVAALFILSPIPAAAWSFDIGYWIDASPAVDQGGTLYVTADDGNLHVIEPDGEPVLPPIYIGSGSIGKQTPTLGNSPFPNDLYMGWDWAVICFLLGGGSQEEETKNGFLAGALSKKWEYPTTSPVSPSLATGRDGTLYFGTKDGKLHALNPANGTPKWVVATGNAGCCSPAVGPDGTIYFANDKWALAFTANGATKWTSPLEQSKTGPVIGSDGTIYFGHNSGLSAFRSDGTKKFDYPTGSQVASSPAIGPDGAIYMGTESGKFFALNGNGTKKWDYTAGGAIKSSPAIGADGTIYFGSDDGRLNMLNASGTLIGWFTAGGPIVSSPALAPNGMLYFGSRDGKLYAIQTDSPGLARSSWPMFGHDPQHTGRAASAPVSPILMLLFGELPGN